MRGMDSSYIAPIAEISTAVGTWVVALATGCLVMGHLWAAKKQRKIALYLELRKEFDSPRLVDACALFAGRLLDGKPHNEMNQEILTFFEDMGMLVRRNYLDRDMIWETFGYFAKMWWSASKDYVDTEQLNFNGNRLLFYNL